MYSINLRGRLLEWEAPLVMGIINATPDSFFAGNRVGEAEAVKLAGSMLEEGAALIDIGAQSTRPGAVEMSAEEEWARLEPVLGAILKSYPHAIVSIDTFWSRVAENAVNAGALMINDISAGLQDEAMLQTVARLEVPYILMHMQGTPQTMQKDPFYKNITLEVLDFLIARISCARTAGIKDIIVDPGFGFGKTIAHNYELLAGLESLQMTGCPLLAGISRKGMIYKPLGAGAGEALNGTTALHALCLVAGAGILRVHDVKEATEAVKLSTLYLKGREDYINHNKGRTN